jgi:hypothetical protein
MFLVDDLLIRPFVSLLDVLHTLALTELYDVEALRDDLKENRLLYEIGERPEAEYRERKAELEAELERARELRAELSDKVEVKG